MKAATLALTIVVALGLLIVVGGHGETAPPAVESAPDASAQTTVFQVDGMTCGLCSIAVTRALESVDGVKAAHVDSDSGRAEITASAAVEPQTLKSTIEKAGYKATLLEGP